MTDLKLPELPEPARRVYATRKNTPSVRHGTDPGGYLKHEWYTADQMRAYAEAYRHPAPDAAGDAWRPIESAPRTGKIDIWVKSGTRYTGCYWDNICCEYRTTNNVCVLVCLPLRICKFWMPEPAPPTDSQGA